MCTCERTHMVFNRLYLNTIYWRPCVSVHRYTQQSLYRNWNCGKVNARGGGEGVACTPVQRQRNITNFFWPLGNCLLTLFWVICCRMNCNWGLFINCTVGYIIDLWTHTAKTVHTFKALVSSRLICLPRLWALPSLFSAYLFACAVADRLV